MSEYPCRCGNETVPFFRCPNCEPTPEQTEPTMDEYDLLLAAYNDGSGDQTEQSDEPENDRWSLRDEGRSDGHGESYAERNT